MFPLVSLDTILSHVACLKYHQWNSRLNNKYQSAEFIEWRSPHSHWRWCTDLHRWTGTILCHMCHIYSISTTLKEYLAHVTLQWHFKVSGRLSFICIQSVVCYAQFVHSKLWPRTWCAPLHHCLLNHLSLLSLALKFFIISKWTFLPLEILEQPRHPSAIFLHLWQSLLVMSSFGTMLHESSYSMCFIKFGVPDNVLMLLWKLRSPE